MDTFDIIGKSLCISYSTSNYNSLTKICIESLNQCGFYNIDHLTDTPNDILLSKTGFQSDLWYYCVKQKIVHLLNVLTNKNKSNIRYFIFNDCDIILIEKNKEHWLKLQGFIDASDKDVFFMRESTSNNVNTGFFIIKNNDNLGIMISFLNKVITEFDKTNKKDMPLGDQCIINKFKGEINYDYIPNMFVIFGKQIYDKNMALFHHATCCRDVNEKLVQINYIQSHFENID